MVLRMPLSLLSRFFNTSPHLLCHLLSLFSMFILIIYLVTSSSYLRHVGSFPVGPVVTVCRTQLLCCMWDLSFLTRD